VIVIQQSLFITLFNDFYDLAPYSSLYCAPLNCYIART